MQPPAPGALREPPVGQRAAGRAAAWRGLAAQTGSHTSSWRRRRKCSPADTWRSRAEPRAGGPDACGSAQVTAPEGGRASAVKGAGLGSLAAGRAAQLLCPAQARPGRCPGPSLLPPGASVSSLGFCALTEWSSTWPWNCNSGLRSWLCGCGQVASPLWDLVSPPGVTSGAHLKCCGQRWLHSDFPFP